MDVGLQRALAAVGQPCHLLELEGGGACFVDMNSVRHFVAYVLNTFGLDVLYTDVDALWLRDPLPSILGAARGSGMPAGLAASRGSFPQELSKSWGATFCTGVMFWYGRWPGALWARYLSRVLAKGNDQYTFNFFLAELNVSWPGLLRYETSDEVAYGALLAFGGISLALLPHSGFPRRCDALPAGGGKDILISHCYNPKAERGPCRRARRLYSQRRWRRTPMAH
mmetsp:Transcript_63011/g.177728  ORF Transcript_63011/g.177728 Transcript_63011/m.177728 type:complete len:225 (+) Transcript_63011:361-1035(+)